MPRSSVIATKVFPVASWTAVMVTPGSTPPVESVTVPVITASWAKPTPGTARIKAAAMANHRIAPEFMKSSSLETHRTTALSRDQGTVAYGAKVRQP